MTEDNFAPTAVADGSHIRTMRPDLYRLSATVTPLEVIQVTHRLLRRPEGDGIPQTHYMADGGLVIGRPTNDGTFDPDHAIARLIGGKAIGRGTGSYLQVYTGADDDLAERVVDGLVSGKKIEKIR